MAKLLQSYQNCRECWQRGLSIVFIGLLGGSTGILLSLGPPQALAQSTSESIELWDDLELLYQKGDLATEAGNYEQAVSIYQEIIRRDANSPYLWSVYRVLAYSLMQLQKYEEAETAYRQAMQQNPSYALLYWELGRCLNKQAIYVAAASNTYPDPNSTLAQEAAVAMYKAIELDPLHPNYRYTLGQILRMLGNWQESKAAFTKSMELDESYTAQAYTEIAKNYSIQAKHDTAENYARQAIKADLEYFPAYFILGQILKNQGSLIEALEMYQKANELAEGEYSYLKPLIEERICRLEQPAGTQCS